MKPITTKLTWLTAILLVGALMFHYADAILLFTGKAATFSAGILLLGKTPSASLQTMTPVVSQPQEESTTPSDPPVFQKVSSIPKPPKGEATGKIETTVLSVNSANTASGGVHVSNRTGLSVDIEEYLQQGLPFQMQDTTQPQVLIVHTHATESYTEGDYGYYLKSASTRSTDNTKNTVAVGEVMAKTLNRAGIVTINDTTQHDYPNYTGGYVRSAQTIEEYLAKYPSIQVVLDVHRDAIAKDDNTKIKPTAEIKGKKAAQVMILAGCETDSVEDFPNWEENFRFCLQLQRQLESDYPNLARPLSFKACKYNFDLLSGSILLEMGTDANTLEEAKYSAELVALALCKVLQP